MYDMLIQSWIQGVDRQNGISDTEINTSYSFYVENYPNVNKVSWLNKNSVLFKSKVLSTWLTSKPSNGKILNCRQPQQSLVCGFCSTDKGHGNLCNKPQTWTDIRPNHRRRIAVVMQQAIADRSDGSNDFLINTALSFLICLQSVAQLQSECSLHFHNRIIICCWSRVYKTYA